MVAGYSKAPEQTSAVEHSVASVVAREILDRIPMFEISIAVSYGSLATIINTYLVILTAGVVPDLAASARAQVAFLNKDLAVSQVAPPHRLPRACAFAEPLRLFARCIPCGHRDSARVHRHLRCLSYSVAQRVALHELTATLLPDRTGLL